MVCWPRGLLVATLVLELPEDVPGSWAAKSGAPSAALSVVLVLGPLRGAGRPRALPLVAGARLLRAACLVLVRTGGILMKEKQASHQQQFWSVIPMVKVGNTITPMGPSHHWKHIWQGPLSA